MRIAVLGVGAIGGVIGAYLTRAGRDVTLIDTWPANIECIRSEGLKVSAVEEEFTVKPTALHLGEVSASGRSFDAIVLSVKSYDTKWAATFAEPYLAPGGFIVSAQNSINEETIAGVVGWSRVVGCVVTLGAGIYEPGRVTRTSDMKRHSFILGEPSGRITERLERIAEVMSAGGPTKTTTNLWGERWAKLATNSMSNALAGITGLKSADLRRHPSTREVSIRVAAELVAVAEALGVSVEPIQGIPAHLYTEALTDGAAREEIEGKMADYASTLREGRPSLAQDIIKGRKTEVEHLNGYVAAQGRSVGVPTPVNDAIVALTRRVASGEVTPSLDNLELLGV